MLDVWLRAVKHLSMPSNNGKMSKLDFRIKILLLASISVLVLYVTDYVILATISFIILISPLLSEGFMRGFRLIMYSSFALAPVMAIYLVSSIIITYTLGFETFGSLLNSLTWILKIFILSIASVTLMFTTPIHKVVEGLRKVGLPKTLLLLILMSIKLLRTLSSIASELDVIYSINYRNNASRLEILSMKIKAITYIGTTNTLSMAEALYTRLQK
jgi:energy-coupling factor transporter transmembrane protein EcfT